MLSNRVALVTGASSGFGRAISMALIEQGVNVVGVARRTDRLQQITEETQNGPGEFFPLPMDVTSEGAGEYAVAETLEKYGQLNILVNNAGVMLHGPILNGDLDDYKTMLDVNVKATIDFTIAALPHLLQSAQKKNGLSDIIMMSSVMGREVKSHKGGYNASKFAINAFADALRLEIIGSFVRVCKLEPGMANTEIAYKVNNPKDRLAGLEMRDKITLLTAEEVAASVIFILQQPRHVNIQEMVIRPVQQL